jgi:hypothetical protein
MTSLDAQITALVTPLETARSSAYKKYRVLMAIGLPSLIVGLILLILTFALSWPSWVKGFGFFFTAAGIILLIIAGTIRMNFVRNTYSTLKNTVENALFPGAFKDPNRGLVLKTLLAPGFFSTPDRYYGRDYMSCTYNNIPFEKAAYDLQRKETHTDSKGNTYTTYETYAKGTMYHFTYERDFGQIVKIIEKSGMLFFGSAGLKKVETEYILFNKKFKVLASDETTVFYLLTPQIQEKIMALESKFRGQFYMAFIGNELFIAVNDSGSSIQIPFRFPITKEVLTPIVECLGIPAVFINLLGLNKNKFEKNAGVATE